MSTFLRYTEHPETKQGEKAEWLDDYFGSHNYGVRFPSDGKVFRADEYEWNEPKETASDLLIGAHIDGKPTTIAETKAGKRIDVTKHEGGRQDVKVHVNTLDVKEKDPATLKAKEHIEKVVIPELANRKVIVTMLHKPSQDHFTFECTVALVRANAEVAVKKHSQSCGFTAINKDDYCLIEHNVKHKEVKVTSL